jgi:hypothetical protein
MIVIANVVNSSAVTTATPRWRGKKIRVLILPIVRVSLIYYFLCAAALHADVLGDDNCRFRFQIEELQPRSMALALTIQAIRNTGGNIHFMYFACKQDIKSDVNMLPHRDLLLYVDQAHAEFTNVHGIYRFRLGTIHRKSGLDTQQFSRRFPLFHDHLSSIQCESGELPDTAIDGACAISTMETCYRNRAK